jgi:xylulokinase
VLRGLTSGNATPAHLARAAVEAVLCSLADAIDNLAACGITARQVTLIGGGARSAAVRAIAPAVFGVPVVVPPPAEYVALGAARQAAWALTGSLPDWPTAGSTAERSAAGSAAGSAADFTADFTAEFTAEPDDAVRRRYAALREDTAGWA